jgi:predicted  nucleic acid-binding Zn-ribbon protein
LSESAEQNLMSRLNELEQKMSNLDNIANALEDELEDMQAISRELKLTDFVDKFGKYIEEVEKVKEDVSCGMFDDIKNEQMKRLVESRVKTVPKDIENLRNDYSNVREQLVELREEIDKGKSSNIG